ncbi:hypothetical protein OSTOST_20305 [Ostertagia ostertagi]
MSILIKCAADREAGRGASNGSATSMDTFVTARWEAASSYGGVSSNADYLSIRSDPSWTQKTRTFRPTTPSKPPSFSKRSQVLHWSACLRNAQLTVSKVRKIKESGAESAS